METVYRLCDTKRTEQNTKRGKENLVILEHKKTSTEFTCQRKTQELCEKFEKKYPQQCLSGN